MFLSYIFWVAIGVVAMVAGISEALRGFHNRKRFTEAVGISIFYSGFLLAYTAKGIVEVHGSSFWMMLGVFAITLVIFVGLGWKMAKPIATRC